MSSRIIQLTIFLFAIIVGPAVLGCAGDSTGSAASNIVDEPQNVVLIDASGHGKLFEVTKGHQIVVRLPGNIATGYKWVVAKVHESFGEPAIDQYLHPQSPKMGAGGTFELVWNTDAVVGVYDVTLEYRQPWDEQADADEVFEFSVEIKPEGKDYGDALIVGAADDGKTLDVVVGREVVVLLEGNISTGHSWVVTEVDRTLGEPISVEYIDGAGGLAGGGGTYELIWSTDSPLPMLGPHKVVMTYMQAWPGGHVGDAFELTMNIVAAAEQGAQN